VSSFRERNDRKRGPETNEKAKSGKGFAGRAHGARPRREDTEGWIWGRHAVEAALANPDRVGPFRLVAAPGMARELEAGALKTRRDVRVEPAEPHEIARLLPPGAVHQGVAMRAPPLEGVDLETLADPRAGFIIMLDQVTDPQNVGAIFRSALAFGAKGIVLQDRNAPALAGALAKAAAGAIERLPCARVVNLSRALETLADLGWRAVGLDGGAEESLEQALDDRPTVLVMGSEGEGLRRLVAEHCDTLAKIPMPGGFESLNVSNAAAIALYEAARRGRA
jgi:23S rRNA (guanosine2251-2'-O)-methyltransferase